MSSDVIESVIPEVVTDGNLPEVERMQHDAKESLTTVQQLCVIDQESYESAGGLVIALAERRQQIVAHHADMKRKAHEAWKSICKAESDLLAPVVNAETLLKQKIGAYEIEQRRIMAERELEARLISEQRAAEQLERVIELAEDAGAGPAEVQAMIDQPMIVSRPTVQPTFQRIAAISTRTTLKAQVYDLRALAKAIGEGLVALNCILANQPALDALARAQGSELSRFVPGVRAVPQVSVAANTRRAK